MKSTSLAPKLAVAVLAAGLMSTTAAPAFAAPTALAPAAPVAAAKSSASTQAAKDSATIVKAISTATKTSEVITAIKAAKVSPALTQQLQGLLEAAPKNAPQALRSKNDSHGSLPSRMALKALQNSVSTTAGTCDENTSLNKYVAAIINFAPEDTQEGKDQRAAVSTLALIGALDSATYQALYEGDTNKTLTRFGEEQDKTKLIKKSFKDIKAWWDIDTGTVTLSAMKDDIATNFTKKGLKYQARYAYVAAIMSKFDGEYDPRDTSTGVHYAEFEAAFVKNVPGILSFVPALDYGENPLYTLNAFAFTPTPGLASEAGLPKRFVFGDGMLSYLRVSKAGDTGIHTVMGHEYGHHLQFVMGTEYPGANQAEKTRHGELEADYFANYYGAHKAGLKYTKAERQLSIDMGYAIGDCGTDSPGHHGTPLQRQAAAVSGQALADTQKKNGHVFAAESVRLKFNKELPNILAAQK